MKKQKVPFLNSRNVVAFAGCLAAGCILAYIFYHRSNNPLAFLLIPVVPGMGYVVLRAVSVRDKGILVRCAVFSCLLAASFVIGSLDVGLMAIRPLRNTDALRWVALTLMLFAFFVWAVNGILHHPIRTDAAPRFSTKKIWIFSSGILFITAMICLLIYYPGNISTDSVGCISYALKKIPLSNQQPVLYTLLIRPFLSLAAVAGHSVNMGAAMFLCFQAAVMSVLTGYQIAWLAKRKTPLWICILVLGFFALCPLFPMFSVTMWKDIPFGGFMMLYVLNLFDISASRGDWLKRPRNFAGFLVLNVLLCFLRNNGYYVVFGTLAVLAVIYRKYWKQLAPAFLAVLVAVPVVQGPVYQACGVQQSPFCESVGIPLQQIAYTVSNGGSITEEQSAFLNRLIPLDEMKKAYVPYGADPIKFHKDFDQKFLNQNKAGFLRVWAGMLGPNLKSYAKAYILQTVCYWHIGTTSGVGVWCGTYSVYGGEKEVGLRAVGGDPPESLRAQIQARMQKVVLFVDTFAQIGAFIWATAFCALLFAVRKKKQFLTALVPLLFLWATLMVAAPICGDLRYIFSFIISLPAVAIAAWPSGSEVQPEKQNGTV